MLKHWQRDLRIFGYWIKRELIRRWKLDTPLGIMGIIALITGIGLMVIIGQSFAALFRAMIPWVAGHKVAEVYWTSVAFAVKVSIVFLIFTVSVLLYFFMRFKNYR